MIPDDFDDEPVEVRMTIAVPDRPVEMGGLTDPTPEEERMARAAAQMVEQARAFLVTDPASYQRAGEMIDQLKTKKRDVVGWFEPMANAAHAAWKVVTGKRAAMVEPLDEAITVLSSRYATFAQQERARAEAERRQLERDAQERERARLQAEADQLAKEAADARAAAAQSTSTAESDALTGQAEQLTLEAQAVRVEAAETQAPVIATRNRLAAIGGPTVVANWGYEVYDKRALVAAVANDEVSQEAVEPNAVYLSAFAKSNKGTRAIPGVRFFDRGSVRASQRR